MKLKTTLLIICVLLSGLNSQLFESLLKKPNLRTNNTPAPVNNIPKVKVQQNVPGMFQSSMFQNFYQKNENRIAKIETNNAMKMNNNANSLFGASKSESNSLFQKKAQPVVHSKPIVELEPAHERHVQKQEKHKQKRLNRKQINEEIHSFIEKSKKITSKIKNNEKKLSNLNNRVEVLVKKNNNIRGEIKKYKVLKRDKKNLESKVTNLLEKYQGEVNNIKSTILKKSQFVETTLKEKTVNFDKVYKSVLSDYSSLQTQVDLVKEKLEEIKRLEDEKFSQMKRKLVMDNMTVKNKLDVNGVAFINKINTENVNLGSISIDSKKLMFNNEGSKIMVGNDVMTVKEFFNIVKTMKYLQEKCGENLEKCKPIDNEYLKQQEKKEIDILESLKNLRQSTNKFLLNKKYE